MKCELCNKKAKVAIGFFNFADMMHPFCEDHSREYKEYKDRVLNS